MKLERTTTRVMLGPYLCAASRILCVPMTAGSYISCGSLLSMKSLWTILRRMSENQDARIEVKRCRSVNNAIEVVSFDDLSQMSLNLINDSKRRDSLRRTR